MADKKISQLTAATTPLAGTEVLPIVQSGSTVKVSSDDLTVKNVRSNATTASKSCMRVLRSSATIWPPSSACNSSHRSPSTCT